MNDISKLSELQAYLYELDYVMGIKDLRDSVIVTAINSDTGKFFKHESEDLSSALQSIKMSVTLSELKGEMTIEKYLVMAEGLTDRDKAFCERALDQEFATSIQMRRMDALQKEDLLNRAMAILDPYSTDYQEKSKSVALLGVIKEYFERIEAQTQVKEIDDCLANKIDFIGLSTSTLKVYVHAAETRKEMILKNKHDSMLPAVKPKLSVV